ncbi:outer membrane beta-barrel protein [Vibrio sp. TRT 17S01]|uniref:outer membrane beta-barrel protein n=1 Tax=Vibrio sp. TRT 17S01 TaxID=3418505 RepID=UPI003CF84E73
MKRIALITLFLFSGLCVSAEQERKPSNYISLGLKFNFQSANDETYNGRDPLSFSYGPILSYTYNKNFFSSLEYQNLNDFYANLTKISLDGDLINLNIGYQNILADDLGFYISGGVSYWQIDKTTNIEELSASGISPIVSVGLTLDIIDQIEMKIGYEYVNKIGNSKTGSYDSSSLLINMSYNFL